MGPWHPRHHLLQCLVRPNILKAKKPANKDPDEVDDGCAYHKESNKGGNGLLRQKMGGNETEEELAKCKIIAQATRLLA